MAIRETRNICIRRSSVPLPKIYSPVSEAFRVAYADEIEAPGVEVMSTLGEVEVGWIAVLPGPGSLQKLAGFRANRPLFCQFSKRLWIFVWARVYTV